MFKEYEDLKQKFEKDFLNFFGDGEFENILNYSIECGKRIRPLILLETVKMINKNVNPQVANSFAYALELIHNYSLIHDDLPCMDNDNYRRGRKTVHYKFGEDFAVLAGDSLLNYASEIIFETLEKHPEPNIISAAKYLFNSSGKNGMIKGQFVDIKDDINTEEAIVEMYRNKTCKLIMSATKIAGYLSNVSNEELDDLEELGFCIGMAFQLEDDLLDIEQDKSSNKVTYISFNGIEKTINDIEKYSNRAIEIISKYENNNFIKELILKLKKREG